MQSLNNVSKFISTTLGRSNDANQIYKNRLFLGNSIISSGFAVSLFFTAKDDKAAQQVALQDVIINSNNLFRCLAPEKPEEHLEEGCKETTLFSALVSVMLAPIVENLKSTTGDVLGAISIPVAAHFVGGLIDYAKTKKESSKATEEKVYDKEAENKKRIKTHLAVGLASLLKAGLYFNNVRMKNGHTSNSIILSSLFNSLKTSVTTQQAFNKGQTFRDPKDVIGILFDGVISQLLTQTMVGITQKANLSGSVGMVITQSVIGGIIASGVLNGTTTLLDTILDMITNKTR